MGEARTKISLDSSSFEKGAKAVTNAAQGMSVAVKAAFSAAGAAVLVAFGANKLANTIRETLEFGEAMANAGRKTGLAAGQFYLFNAAMNKGIGLKTAASLIGKNAEVLDRSANIFRDVSIKLWAIGEQIRGFWLGLLERLSPVLSHILDGGLGTALLDAGNDFGAALAHAVEVVYQLAKDGKLWTTIKDGFGIAFDYAGERILWFAQTSYDAIYNAVFNALYNAVTTSFADIKKAFQELATILSFNIAYGLVQAANTFTGIMDKWGEGFKKFFIDFATLGPIGAALALAVRKVTEDPGKSALSVANSVSDAAKAKEKGVGPLETIKNTFKNNPFSASGALASRIENFGQGLTNAFTKYQREAKENPAKAFENNLYPNAFGADSLTTIGGGGGVYMGLSVLDVNKSQLKVLQSIDSKMRTGGLTTGGIVTNNFGASGMVTRTQTTPVQGISPAGAH